MSDKSETNNEKNERLAEKLDIQKVDAKELGKTPAGTVPSISVQNEKSSKKVIWYMVAVSFYAVGVSFVSYFLFKHLKKYILALGFPELEAESLFYLTAAIGILVFFKRNYIKVYYNENIER